MEIHRKMRVEQTTGDKCRALNDKARFCQASGAGPTNKRKKAMRFADRTVTKPIAAIDGGQVVILALP